MQQMPGPDSASFPEGQLPPPTYVSPGQIMGPHSQFLSTLYLLTQLNQWTIVFIFFLMELVICTLIIAPLPVSMRRRIVQGLSWLWNKQPRARVIMKTSLAVVGIFFLDAVRKMYVLYMAQLDPYIMNAARGPEMDLSLFEAERNAFLCGCTLFLFFMLHRFQSMLTHIADLESRLEGVNPDLVSKSELHVKNEYNLPKAKETHIDNAEHDKAHLDSTADIRKRPLTTTPL